MRRYTFSDDSFTFRSISVSVRCRRLCGRKLWVGGVYVTIYRRTFRVSLAKRYTNATIYARLAGYRSTLLPIVYVAYVCVYIDRTHNFLP